MSSRLSYELVYKCHAIGAACLATISAPTSLALDTAELLHLELACLAFESNARTGASQPYVVRFPDAAGRVR